MTHIMTIETVVEITNLINSDMFALEVLIHMGFSFMGIILALLVFEQVAGSKSDYSNWAVETPAQEAVEVMEVLSMEVSEMLANVETCITDEADNLVISKDPLAMTSEEWRAEVVKATETAARLNEQEVIASNLSYGKRMQRQAAYERLMELGSTMTAQVMIEEHNANLARINRVNTRLHEMFA